MGRKNFLVLLLITGIASSIFIQSCGKTTVDPVDTFSFTYINNSGKDIEIVIFMDDVEKARKSILKNESLEEVFSMPKDDNQIVITDGDSLVIIFEDLKQLSHSLTDESELNIINWDNYEITKTKREHFLTYTFTLEDYNAAN